MPGAVSAQAAGSERAGPSGICDPAGHDHETGAEHVDRIGHREVSCDEAFAAVRAELSRVVGGYGPAVVGLYFGNPNAHTMAGAQHRPSLIRALRTRALFSASTVDQMPMHVACGLVFGHPSLIPVPDLDRTDHLLILGANPAVSNGSLCTAPDFPGRMGTTTVEFGGLTSWLTIVLNVITGNLNAPDEAELALIGRRHLRTNNSWMHNVPALAKGRNRCTLLISPQDAARRGVRDGGSARITSATRMSVAADHAGVNTNILTDGSRVDLLSGNAVLNGIPVRVIPAD